MFVVLLNCVISKLQKLDKMRSFVIWILAAESLYSVFALYTDCTWTYFDNEVVVNCSGRGLTSITRFNDSVTYLDLSHNRFSSIPVKSLPNNLKHLDISWNNIKQIKVRSRREYVNNLDHFDALFKHWLCSKS